MTDRDTYILSTATPSVPPHGGHVLLRGSNDITIGVSLHGDTDLNQRLGPSLATSTSSSPSR